MSTPPSELGTSTTDAPPEGRALRRFGRFELKALLSKTSRSMLWLVSDPGAGRDLLLCLPRVAPNSPDALAHWLKMAQAGARIQHPNLAPVLEIGQVEHWPFLAYERSLGETLDERLAQLSAPLPLDAAGWICQALEGLAYAHEAGHAHRDVQTGAVLIDASNHVRLIGLEVAQEVFPATVNFNTVTRRATREWAEEDVLCMGLLAHRLLSARPVLGEADLQLVLQRMQPLGHELVRLGFENPHPLAEPLRAIVNRATDRQARQRYHSARSFLRALDGWRSAASDQGGAVAQLLDRMQRVGHLPIASLRLQRVAQSSSMEGQHASELSGLVLQDMALSLEMLRRVNNALRQQGALSGGAVLNMQRAVAMLGLIGLQQAARALKPWPGVMSEAQSHELAALMKRVRHAGAVAQALRPAGYDAEVVYLVALLQNLGRLLLQYHFPDDALQIRQLMRHPEPTPDQPRPQGMSEQAAAYAVLGCDLDALGAAVARHWSLGDEVQQMIRRQPLDTPLRSASSDTELLRLTASLANELVDAQRLPQEQRRGAIEQATRRYARVLGLGLGEIEQALHAPQQAQPAEVRSTAAEAPPTAGGEAMEAERSAAAPHAGAAAVPGVNLPQRRAAGQAPPLD